MKKSITPAILTIELAPQDKNTKSWDMRITRILVRGEELRCSSAQILFKPDYTENEIVLHIPLRYVNLSFLPQEDM